ncbi:unnamed protein product [Alternaria alternata]
MTKIVERTMKEKRHIIIIGAGFASSGEIQSYLSHVVDHFDLAHHIEFKTTVTRSAWSEQESKWLVDTECNGIVNKGRKADVLINAAGILNHYRYPDIPGLDSYRGRLIHTADWDHSIDLAGEEVSRESTTTPTTPQVTSNAARALRATTTNSFLSFTGIRKTQTQKREELELWMRKRIADPSLRKNLIPNYELGCRRISPGEPFLQALQKPNVTCIFSPILTCQPEGLETQDGIETSDVIIAATGFDTSFRPRFPLLGRNGIDLRDLWKDDPISYMGLGCAEFPNYLSMLGPNCPVANGSLIGSLEAMADFFVRLLKRVDSFGVATFMPDKGAQEDFNMQVEGFMQGAVWTGNCTNKRGKEGRITAVWPGSSLHYREVLEQDRWEDWNWTYRGRRYGIWGKGESAVEKAGGDHSHYLEHGPLLRMSSLA